MIGKKSWRRLPIALLVAGCATTLVIAVSGASPPVRGLDFAPSGHWVANPAQDVVAHVGGASKTVDSRAPMVIEPGSQVYQGETSGYVVGEARIREFGKSSLEVERTIPAPTGERPVGIEAPGGPYLVYREAGTIVVPGTSPKHISVGGRLGKPVVTPDGTLWLHRQETGVLCKLPKGSGQVTCPTAVESGHDGSLTVVGEQPAFVDTTDDTMRTVSDSVGGPVNLGVDLSAGAKVAGADAAGRIPILDPATSRLHLVDGTALTSGKPPAPRVEAEVPDGEYVDPEPSGSAVVLLDVENRTIRTYSGDGRAQGDTPVPEETGDPTLTRGQDARVYVDGHQGGHVQVIDPGGEVTGVPVVGEQRGERGEPKPPPPDRRASQPEREPDDPDRQPERAPDPPPDEPPPEAGPETEPDPPPDSGPATGNTPAPPPPPPPPAPASPPGVAVNLIATVVGEDVRVTWGAAEENGAPITAYHVSWGSGGQPLPGDARVHVISGLEKNVRHTITVVAENKAGRGPAVSRNVMIEGPAITIQPGEREGASEYCGDGPDCRFIHVVATGLPEDKMYEFQPYNEDGQFNDGHGSEAENGRVEFHQFAYDVVGSQVWVEIPELGVKSNVITWPAA